MSNLVRNGKKSYVTLSKEVFCQFFGINLSHIESILFRVSSLRCWGLLLMKRFLLFFFSKIHSLSDFLGQLLGFIEKRFSANFTRWECYRCVIVGNFRVFIYQHGTFCEELKSSLWCDKCYPFDLVMLSVCDFSGELISFVIVIYLSHTPLIYPHIYPFDLVMFICCLELAWYVFNLDLLNLYWCSLILYIGVRFCRWSSFFWPL